MNYAVIGYPIKHSYSPLIHNNNFEYNKDNYQYGKLEIKTDALSSIRQIIKENQLQGINVTIPHKEKIIPYLDYVDIQAKDIKAVNTVKVIDNELHGYNTDIDGYKETITENEYAHNHVLILGAGGAAKAVLLAHLELGSNVTMLARRKESFSSFNTDLFNALVIDEFIGGHFDIVVNATPLGLNNEDAFQTFNLSKLHDINNTLGYDLIYNPSITPFMSYFSKQQNGLDMLINQALLSYTIWTGKKGNKELVRKVMNNELREWN